MWKAEENAAHDIDGKRHVRRLRLFTYQRVHTYCCYYFFFLFRTKIRPNLSGRACTINCYRVWRILICWYSESTQRREKEPAQIKHRAENDNYNIIQRERDTEKMMILRDVRCIIRRFFFLIRTNQTRPSSSPQTHAPRTDDVRP